MTRKNTGFTLVEILIVVIILGILAAIVIPQFTEASNDARKSALVSDLQTVRSQVELYKVQHLEVLPGGDANSWDATTFHDQLTMFTDVSGNTNASKSTTYKYGPYLQKFPTNAFNDSSAVKKVTADPNADGDISGTEGWWFNPSNGRFGANYAAYWQY